MHLCGMWDQKVSFHQTKKLNVPQQKAGGFLDIEGSHSLGEIAMKGALKGMTNLGRIAASKAIQSDFAKQKIKGMAVITWIKLWIV